MKIAVVGSRNYSNLDEVVEYIENLAVAPFKYPSGWVIELLSGGARGVDLTAMLTAKRIRLPYEHFPADWKKDGKRAGMLRNAEIVKAADKVVIFWDGESPGTRNVIDQCHQQKVDYEVHFDEAA